MCLALNPALRHPDEAKRKPNPSTAWDGTAIEWEPSHHRNLLFFTVLINFVIIKILFLFVDSDYF
jgi:hypothetical protein